MDGFNDDEIARAIALSLKEATVSSSVPTHKHRKPVEVIEIDSDDEELPSNDEEAQFQADVRRAMEASKSDAGPSTATSSRQASISPYLAPAAEHIQLANNPLLFDRKRMEEERLARQKRLRPEMQQSSATVSDEDEEDDEERGREKNAKRQRISSTLPSAHRTNTASSSNAANARAGGSSSSRENNIFWEGELRQNANRFVNPAEETRPIFRLSEIFGPKDDIAFAILSAYVVEQSWIYEFFNRGTPVVLVAQDPQGNETMKEILPEWIRTTTFLANGRVHARELIFYKTGRLRVVVSTANLIQYDWRDIENTAWVQDFPLRSAPIPHDPKATDFPATFSRILRSLNVVAALLNMARNGHDDLPLKCAEDLRCKWDFSKAKVFLIPSIAGKHEGWPKVVQTGHTALMKALRDMGARTGKDRELTLECQGSSIGAYSTQWTNEFYCSAQGESAETWLDQPRSRRMKLPYPPLRILFPSRKTVRESALGEPGGGTMFCRRAQWAAPKFPRELFYDSNSKRGPVLMHSKMIIGIFKDTAFASGSSSAQGKNARNSGRMTDPDSDDDIVEVTPDWQKNLVGWAYVGSHNFTPSAWGNLSGTAFNPVMNL
ncbi:hypothetical protein EUX98_g5632 [Antrodiella citrinella]|uniref:PLD phosphodiesterase domain-containing protein n=1 Tax=Antrodiella citrinella TaxID=2447956 RepID=A0A4S4MR00_9APHY|nr:hypothetical protein EUX98_g5632 [Antrodiella citrinella]